MVGYILLMVLSFCRIHTLAGTVNASDVGALTRAEETFIANLRYAADKCAEVCFQVVHY